MSSTTGLAAVLAAACSFLPSAAPLTDALGAATGTTVAPSSITAPFEQATVADPTVTDATARVRVAAISTLAPSVTISVDPTAGAQSPANASREDDSSEGSTGPANRRWQGTGAALTDAALARLKASPEATRLLFDPKSPTGAHLTWVRLPLSSTDYSPTTWSWSMRDGTAVPPAPAVEAASFVRDVLLPMNPQLKVAVTAWSAPAAMKDSGTLRGGALLPAATRPYADLLVAQVDWLQGFGVPVDAVSAANEPGHSSDYTSMTTTDAQLATIDHRLSERLPARRGGGAIQIWGLDHNWSDAARVKNAEMTDGAVNRIAFHCYGGDAVSAHAAASAQGLSSIVSECSGTTDTARGTYRWDSANLVIGPVRNGSTGLLFWNAALSTLRLTDTDTGSLWGCKSCRGVISVQPTGTVMPEPEFDVLRQLAIAADPGARIIKAASTNASTPAVAFRNPDGTVGVYAFNDNAIAQTVRVQGGDHLYRTYLVPPGAIFAWRSS